MLGYAARRILLIVPVIFFALSVLFFAFYVLPGDPATLLAGGNARAVTPEVRHNIDQKYGLDKPLIVQFGRYWNNVLHGNLGDSYKQGRSVNSFLKQEGPASVRLALWAIIIEVVIGIGVGILSAVKKYSLIDAITAVGTTAAMAIPVFVLGFLLQFILGVYPGEHNWPAWIRFPVQANQMPDTWFAFIIPTGHQWKYLVLPAICLASVNTAVVARMARTTMIEISGADYMRTARAKGLSETVVTFKHGLRNALIPVITLIGLDLGTMIGAAVLTETVFAWPGIGSQIASSAAGRDAPVVLGLTLVVVVAYVVINLLVDLSYGWLDPRIRYGKEGA